MMIALLKRIRTLPEPPSISVCGVFVIVAVVAIALANAGAEEAPKTATVHFNGSSFTYPVSDKE